MPSTTLTPAVRGLLAGLALGAALTAAAAYALMRRRDHRLGRFLSNTIHEINAPITAVNITILNFLEGLFGGLAPEHLRWLEMTREQLIRLNGMIAELYDFSHLALCRDAAIHTENVAAPKIIDEALASFKPGAAPLPAAFRICS